MEGSNGVDDINKPRDAELPLKDMRNWQLIPSANESPVKSTAIVKYSAVQRAASFTQLQCDTDLNSPPSNWLTSSAESYGLQHVPAHSTGFSSFRLAHMFPDCVGQVDVVSDAENIKKLLKIPYSRGAVSMMVHRIENTLLIDDFDVHKLLLQQSRSDWEWLREFLLSNVLQTMSIKDKGLVPSHRRSALQSKHLVSKFLHHSLAATNPAPPPPLIEPTRLPLSAQEPPLPEPQATEEIPDSRSQHKFLRNVVWNFEDLQMLLGTDMPIFGGPAHPCISLRLCDMAKPISVLTGIDYWLDNLMSNVPEVVMCFHLDGIVKRYELVKTEDLPFLEDSKFSPKVVRDVAQNILSFLKTNAAKAGHTYWLFKGKDDDVVKLYDLTSLCSGNVDERGQNPFTVPVAMLLYRVARNMKHSPDGQHKRSTIAVLLENCIRLLDAEKYPQIVTSAHFMLSDLYIPATLDPAKPVFDDELDDEEREEGNQNLNYANTNSLFKKREQKDAKGSHYNNNLNNNDQHKAHHLIQSSDSESEEVNIIEPDKEEELKKTNFKERYKTSLTSVMSLNLLKSGTDSKSDTDDDEATKYSKPPPLAASVPERCMLALKHIAVGLQCLQYFGKDEAKNATFDEKKVEEEETPHMAKPFEPIPMPYAPLNKQDKKEDHDPSKQKKSRTKNTKNNNNEDKRVKNGTSEEKSDIKKLLCPMPVGCMPTWQTPEANDAASWNTHLKTLLYEKACLVYATLAENAYAADKFGRALQMIGRVLRCREALNKLLGPLNPNRANPGGLESYLLGRAGDCCFMLVQDWPSIEMHRRHAVSNTGVDAEIEHEMFRDCPDLDSPELSLIPEKLESMEQMLKSGLACYERGLAISPQLVNFYRRIGNTHNELGVLYMSQAQVKFEELNKRMNMGPERMDPLLKASFTTKFDLSLHHFEAGISAFETVNDKANIALLHSNVGRLLRLCAVFYSPVGDDPKEHHHHERTYHNKSLTSYQNALANLGQRKGHEEIWDAVNWEYSSALYNMALIAMEHPAPHLIAQGREEIERQVIEYFNRALKTCEPDIPGPRQPLYQFRVGLIHHKLAAIYHRQYRDIILRDHSSGPSSKDERHARALLHTTLLHYEKCREMFVLLERPLEYFDSQLERVALYEAVVDCTPNPVGKLRTLNTIFELFFISIPMLNVIINRDEKKAPAELCKPPENQVEVKEKPEHEKELDLLLLYERRIQMDLLSAVKTCAQCSKKELAAQETTYRLLYGKSLRKVPMPEDKREALVTLAKYLVVSVSDIENEWKCKIKQISS